MDFSLSQEQKEYKKEITNFAKENLNNEQYLEEYSEEMWKKISEFGLLGLNIGEEYGGLAENYKLQRRYMRHLATRVKITVLSLLLIIMSGSLKMLFIYMVQKN